MSLRAQELSASFKNLYFPCLINLELLKKTNKSSEKYFKCLEHRKNLVSLSSQECIIKKSVRCVLNVLPHSQTTTATTKEEHGPKVTRTEIFVHPAESWGLSTYLWLYFRKQTLICWWSYYVVMKHRSFTEVVQYFFNHWLKYSKFKFFIRKQKTKE